MVEFNFYKFVQDPLENILKGLDRAGSGIAGAIGGLLTSFGGPTSDGTFGGQGRANESFTPTSGSPVVAAPAVTPVVSLAEQQESARAMVGGLGESVQAAISSVQSGMASFAAAAGMSTASSMVDVPWEADTQFVAQNVGTGQAAGISQGVSA